MPPRPDAGIEPGTLLVASPLLRDPNFARTVVFVIDHDGSDRAAERGRPGQRGGTTGVILNRPSDTELLDVLPQWWDLAVAPQTLFVGGPVETNAALCLSRARPGHQPPGWTAVFEEVGLTDLDTDPESAGPELAGIRVFAGYSGWAAQQLAGEIEQGAWLVVPGQVQDVFGDPERDLWQEVLRRQGGRMALVATFPDDPRLN